MQWNRTQTLALSKEACTHCMGYGLKSQNKGDKSPQPCGCVLRNIFRTCYARFRYCSSLSPHMSTARIERIPGAINGPQVYGRKNEEYVADFCNIAKRVLNSAEYQLFKFHFLLGADWKLCCPRLKLDRGDFFHAVYRVQQKLGRAFRETEPYGIFPLDEYFGGAIRSVNTKACAVDGTARARLIAPLAPAVEVSAEPVSFAL